MINSQNNLSINEMGLSDRVRNKSTTHKYKAVKEHLCCDLNGTSVILSLASGKYFGVNSVGSFIWSIIQDSKTFDEIQELVLDEFEVEVEVCRKEVQLFLEKMKKHNLIEISDE